MIHETLKFLAEEINTYLSIKLGVTTDPRLVLGNVSKAFDTEGSSNALSNKAILSLVNVEEDRVSKNQENFVKTATGVTYKPSPVLINLYVLFAINRTTYDDSLQYLTYIIQYFQHQNVFTPLSHPALPTNIERLLIEMVTLNFEQVNHLWSTLGGKYLPSALFKIRQVTIDEDATQFEAGLIKEIGINERHKLPVS